MSMMRGMVVLALVAMAATAGAGWALKAPQADKPVAHERATAQDATPGPSLSVLAWPQTASELDASPVQEPGDGEQPIDGLEAMSVTGAASPRD